MFILIMATILLLVAVVIGIGFGPIKKVKRFIRSVAATVTSFLAVFVLSASSWVIVGSDEVGHLRKIYGTSSLKDGRIIATDGEKGYQAEVLAPGFHFIPGLNIFYDVEMLPVVEIPAGMYGRIETTDGNPLPLGAIMAQEWKAGTESNMLDATFFLENGGNRGLQSSVLTPGTYRLNLYLYKVRVGNGSNTTIYDKDGSRNANNPIDTTVTEVRAGYVGVVKSNIAQDGIVCREEEATVDDNVSTTGALSATLVPRGCVGIWNEPLEPGAYFMNRNAFEVTMVNTRVQTWQYKGGFTKRIIDLAVDAQTGQITQTPREEVIKFDPAQHADRAIFVKSEGWDIPVEVRAVVQVSPENAPIVVASVGGLDEVEDRILTPAIRSEVRNIGGGTITYTETVDENGDGQLTRITRPTRALDFIGKRGVLERNVQKEMRIAGSKAGVDIREIRFGEPSIPPELLVARQREQLADQLQEAYARELQAEQQRIETENARAVADQQNNLVTEQIALEKARLTIERRTAEGEAEKAYATLAAEGEQARVNVLGQDRVLQLRMVEAVLATLEENPEILTGIQLPSTFVSGGSGLEAFGAILGDRLNSNNQN